MGLIKDPRYVNHRNQALCAGIWEFLFFTSIELENLLCTICHMWWIISLSESASYFHWSVCSGPAKYHQDVFIFGVDSPLTLSAAFSVFLPFLSLMLLKFETPFILKPQFTSPSSLESWIELTSHLSLPLSPPLSHTHTHRYEYWGFWPWYYLQLDWPHMFWYGPLQPLSDVFSLSFFVDFVCLFCVKKPQEVSCCSNISNSLCWNSL